MIHKVNTLTEKRIDVLTGINGVNNKISEIVIAFAQTKPQVMRSPEEIIIKAD